MAKQTPKLDREAFLSANIAISGSKHLPLPPAAVDDMKFFREQFLMGKRIKFAALKAWLEERHHLVYGKQALHNACKDAGIEPWWSKA